MKTLKRHIKRLRYRYDLLSDQEKKSFKKDLLECTLCTLMFAAVITIMVLSILLEK